MDTISKAFDNKGRDLCDFLAIQQALFVPDFHAGNHDIRGLARDESTIWHMEHVVPRDLDKTSRPAAISIHTLTNIRPLAKYLNRVKGNRFETDGHDVQVNA